MVSDLQPVCASSGKPGDTEGGQQAPQFLPGSNFTGMLLIVFFIESGSLFLDRHKL